MEEHKTYVHSTLESGQNFFIEDQWKRKYHFRIASFLTPTGLAFEAIEVKNDDSSVGYMFNQLFDYETDPEIAEQILIKKIKKGLNQRHLKKYGSKWEIGKRDTLRGRIEWNEDFSDTDFDRVFVIDGQRITIEEFGRMFEPFEGFNFVFKIKDPYDD
jgi:hypothetical protein